MGCISAIDPPTRVEVQELLSRYCHYLDHDRGECWSQLFTSDGQYEDSDGLILRGTDALRSLPAIIRRNSAGMLRHMVSAIIVDRCEASRDLVVSAYGPVVDLRGNGGFSTFYDYKVQINRVPAWRIAKIVATRVGGTGATLSGAAYAGVPLHS
ncbi:nuclear transport factor 2 family protein [Sphingomonas sp. PB4P5]|uniref:nuclear transport factor 2 family protein n=1 Tax=Parasphingomonas puruogangriensis TaxID=3096155 RepID=UPI002FCC84E5